jgi:PAS domain S-box-containing protein
MKDANKTKKQLIDELSVTRQRIAQLEGSAAASLNEEHYRIMVEASPVAIMAIRNGCFFFVNSAGARMLGFSDPEEMLGLPALRFVAPESEQLVTTRIKRLEKGMENPLVEIELIRQDGMKITGESTSASISIDGIPAAVILVQDISDGKILDMQLRENEERLNSFMDHYPANIYIKDQSLKHIYANKHLLEGVGLGAQEFIGTTSHDFFPSDVAKRIEENDRVVLTEEVLTVREHEREMQNGRTRRFRDLKFPIQLSTGESLVGGISIDITDLKEAEEKLKIAFDEISDLKSRLEQENIYLREEIEVMHKHEEILGKSDAVRKMLSQAEQVAETDSTVLILGETGTGKELLARAIHTASARKDHQMVKVNCAALPASLIESEFFGREKGAYTGALSRQVGRFEIADGSTIFLDEIGELPMELQVKLLRVLHEGQFERLGSPKSITVDVRVIAATNRDLEAAIEKGNFREDLYYRLNVYPMEVPPLRERPEDIVPLVWAFVREFGERMGKKIDRIPRNAMEALKRYSWPGNVRELKNIVERAMILSKGSTLKLAPPRARPAKRLRMESLDELQREHIAKALEMTGWRVSGKSGAATLLQINPKTLESKMRKLGISRKEKFSDI